MILSSWRIGLDGKRQHAPFYDLKVLAPADPGVKPKVLHQQRIEPSDSWNWGALEQKGVDPMGGTATETIARTRSPGVTVICGAPSHCVRRAP